MSDTTDDSAVPEDPDDLSPDDMTDSALRETVNLTDPKSLKRSNDRRIREWREEASFWRAVLNDKTGRRILWKLLIEKCHGFSPPFLCGPNGFPHPQATYYGAGQHSIGQYLYNRWLSMAPDGVVQMRTENDPEFIEPKRDPAARGGEI